MNLQHSQQVLYDLALTIAGEPDVTSLQRSFLQRMLYHTGFSSAVLVQRVETGDSDEGCLLDALGARGMRALVGQTFSWPAHALQGGDALLVPPFMPESLLQGNAPFGHALRLVAGKELVLFFFSHRLPAEPEMLITIFAPILSRFAQAHALCAAAAVNKRQLELEVEKRTAELQSSEARWKFALEGAGDGVWDWYPESDEAHFSTRWKAMLGYGEEEFPNTGKAWADQIHPEDAPKVQRTLSEFLAGQGTQLVQEFRMRCKDGSWKWILSRGMLIRDFRGKAWRMLGTHTDISEHKQIEHKLTEASRAKSEFLANMSHEIRTPMNGVIGLLDVLSNSQLTESQRRMVGTIQESSLSLLRILNDILDLSKIEAGKLDVEQVATNLRDVVESVANLLQSSAAGKALAFFVFVSPQLPDWFVSDATRLRQILMNLVGNAIKFTSGRNGQRGQITLRAEPVSLAEGRSGVRFRIIDNGIGMSAEMIAKLFRPFTQADESTSRQFGGTGLGLSISQRLVDLLGGKIQVSSTPNVGSEFTVDFALQAIEPAQSAAPLPDMKGVQVLCVAKRPESREILEQYCGAAGVTVQWATDAVSAAAILSRSEQVAPVVLFDADVAVHEIESLRGRATLVQLLLRNHSVTVPSVIPIHTCPLFYRDLIRGLAVACGRMRMEEFAISEERRLQTRRPLASVEEASAAGSLILLAEDNEINREVMREQLHLLGYTVEVAEDGVEALEKLGQRDYALLLTDCHMPRMDGFELTARIRKQERVGKHLPVVAVTANALQGEADRCLGHGMDDYLSKPLRIVELEAKLTKWLPHTGEPATYIREVAPLPETGKGQGTDAGVSENDLPVWDAQALTRMVGDNPGMHKRLLEKFLLKVPAQIATILQAVENVELEQVVSVTHALKSGARAIGAMQLGQLCFELEQAGKAGDADSCVALSRDLDASMLAVEVLIRERLG